MDLSSVAQYVIPAISASATLIGVVIAARKNEGLRSRIKEDVDILSNMKEGTLARDALTAHVDWEVDRLIRSETVGERQWGFGVFALVATLALTALSTWLLSQGGLTLLWLTLTLPFTLVFIYGMIDSFSKLPRDEKGNTIRDQT
jgi:hypothetical protein